MLKKTLYVLALRGNKTDTLFMLYAVDETEAEERAAVVCLYPALLCMCYP